MFLTSQDDETCPKKNDNTRQFDRTINLIVRKMPPDLSVGACRPSGSLAVVDLAQMVTSVEKVVSQWRSWGKSGSSAFTYPCVRIQWVINTNPTIDTYNSTLEHIPWQDWTRIWASLSNLKSYCTSPDIGACPNTRKFTANPQSPNERIHLLTPKPQKNHIDRSSSVMVAKYPKLCRYSERIFSSNKAMSTLRAIFATKSNSWFLGRWRRFTTLVRTD